jgi:phospholipid/cholesterol/gamma-HCH transport system substrate-binding protein
VRSRWNLPIYVAYVGICITALGFIVLQMGITLPWSNPYRLTAVFQNGAGILANNEVFMNGTKVGRIDSVEAVNGQAQVTMIVENPSGLPIYRDAAAQVRIKNLLGETYVEIARGDRDSGEMPTGGVIPAERTITPVQIDEVLAVLDPQSRQRLQLLINGAGDALANNGQNLNDQAGTVKNLFTSLNGPAAELKARQQQLDDIVLELQRFYDVLARQRDEVRQEFVTWNDVMAQEAAQNVAISGTIQQADQLLTSLGTLVAGEVPNLRSTFGELPATLVNLNNFLTQSDTILNSLTDQPKVLQGIHDVFSALGTSFADTDPTTPDPNALGPKKFQHLWSVYSVSLTNCAQTCSNNTSGYSPVAPNATWAAVLGGATR